MLPEPRTLRVTLALAASDEPLLRSDMELLKANAKQWETEWNEVITCVSAECVALVRFYVIEVSFHISMTTRKKLTLRNCDVVRLRGRCARLRAVAGKRSSVGPIERCCATWQHRSNQPPD